MNDVGYKQNGIFIVVNQSTHVERCHYFYSYYIYGDIQFPFNL